jgi:hypothetical protein
MYRLLLCHCKPIAQVSLQRLHFLPEKFNIELQHQHLVTTDVMTADRSMTNGGIKTLVMKT